MKVIFYVLLSFLTGCQLSKTNEDIIVVKSLNDYWNILTGPYATGTIYAVPQNELSTTHNTVISVDITEALIALESPDCQQNTISLGYDKVALSFMKLSHHNFTFINNHFKIIKGNKAYTLQSVDGKNSSHQINVSPQENVQGEVYWPNRYHNFRLPFVCNDLDKTIFEISGIYSDGKELPPIRFQINLLDNARNIKTTDAPND